VDQVPDQWKGRVPMGALGPKKESGKGSWKGRGHGEGFCGWLKFRWEFYVKKEEVKKA
jgi:hypothetical protein